MTATGTVMAALDSDPACLDTPPLPENPTNVGWIKHEAYSFTCSSCMARLRMVNRTGDGRYNGSHTLHLVAWSTVHWGEAEHIIVVISGG